MSVFWKKCLNSSKPVLFSQVFRIKGAQPKENIKNPASCKSLKLMLTNGLISSSSTGIFYLMPILLRSLDNLCILIESTMNAVGGQKMLLPLITQSKLWKVSGRWDDNYSELFKLQDRHSINYCLGPTHEEAATNLFSSLNLSYKSFPLRIFQMSTKFRDEMKPKYGLLRGREFVMKDMYTFDTSEEDAEKTYSEICVAYDKLFQLLGVKYVKVQASNVGMGGSTSHEFHFISDIGEDELLICPKCNSGVNVSLSGNEICHNCGVKLEKQNGIEVGHAFILGTTYSEPFDAKYTASDNTFKSLHMGCYGLGVTRILAACIECLSTSENIRWPLILCPFLVSIVPPKSGSKEEQASIFAKSITKSLCGIDCLANSVLYDDRTNFTIGKRINDAKNLGIPYIIVTGSTVLNDVPKVEVIDSYNDQSFIMSHAEMMHFFNDISKNLVNKYII